MSCVFSLIISFFVSFLREYWTFEMTEAPFLEETLAACQ